MAKDEFIKVLMELDASKVISEAVTYEEFNAGLHCLKTPETEKDEWNSLLGKEIQTQVTCACNFANLGGISYPLPIGMNRGDTVTIKFIEILHANPDDNYYKVELTWDNKKKLGRANVYGTYPVFRVSFYRE